MRKRKVLSVALPFVSAAVIVGTGFSAWYFQNDEGFSTSTTASVNVTHKVVTTGSITADSDNPGQLYLDQPNQQGIYWYSSPNTVTDFGFYITPSVLTSGKTTYTQMTATITVSIDSALANYVEFDVSKTSAFVATPATGSATTGTATTASTTSMAYSVTVDINSGTKTQFTLDLTDILKYYTADSGTKVGILDATSATKETLESFNEAKYDAMVTALETSKVSFSYGVEFVTGASATTGD